MLKKAYTKTGRSCRVTFAVPSEVNAKKVALCGEFNDWDPKSHLLKRRKDGSFSTTLSLPAGRHYRFRYFVDGERWENDFDADDYKPNPYGSDDSILKL